MTVRRLLRECDSNELAEWWAYDQRWPLADHWKQTARICRTVMSASGNYKRVPEEHIFIPSILEKRQTEEEMVAELSKLVGKG